MARKKAGKKAVPVEAEFEGEVEPRFTVSDLYMIGPEIEAEVKRRMAGERGLADLDADVLGNLVELVIQTIQALMAGRKA